MSVLGRRSVVLFGAEDEFRRSQHDRDHRLRAGFPVAAVLLALEPDLHVAVDLGGRGRAAERAADEGIGDEAGAGFAGRRADDDGQAALEFGARVGRAEQA